MRVLAALQRALGTLRPIDAGEPQAARAPDPMRVLVVDDDPAVLDSAEEFLIAGGHVPLLTSAPQSALQIARSMRPSVILLDVLMPGFDGWDVLAALKADPKTSAIPVVMICMLGERKEALAAGASGIIDKPLDLPKVRRTLAGIAASGHRGAV